MVDLAALERALPEIRTRSHIADAQHRFPLDNIQSLHGVGAFKLLVPAHLGGTGWDIPTFVRICHLLGQGCLSTAIVFAMHSQQVATLAGANDPAFDWVLLDVLEHGALIASITTEKGGTSDLLTALCYVESQADGRHILKRTAPFVSYGCNAKYFLTTARNHPGAAAGDVGLYLLTAQEMHIEQVQTHHMHGMRGTATVGMDFTAEFPANRHLPQNMHLLLTHYMVPVIHLGWSAAWLGALEAALQTHMQQCWQTRAGRQKTQSELFKHRMGHMWTQLMAATALLEQVAADVHEAYQKQAPGQLTETRQVMRLNGLKVHASQTCQSLINELVEVAGLARSYLANYNPIEQTLRDLRSATLMFHNDALMEAIGKMAFLQMVQQSTPKEEPHGTH